VLEVVQTDKHAALHLDAIAAIRLAAPTDVERTHGQLGPLTIDWAAINTNRLTMLKNFGDHGHASRP